MDQKIRYEKHRIVLILAYGKDNGFAVLLHNDAVQRKRAGNKLIFLDAAVIVCIQITEAAFFVQRILFDIHSGAVDVRSQNVQAVFHRLRTDLKQHNGLVHPRAVNLIAGL